MSNPRGSTGTRMADRLQLTAEEMADMLARALKQAHDEESICSCWPGPCRLTAYDQWKRDRARQKKNYEVTFSARNDGSSDG